jgi:aspartyl-tRNA(Asn)/glutamyl-tRNA(Gln) amidotransferase subunit A
LIDVPLSIGEAAAGLRDGRLTSRRLTEAMIARADRLDERLGTFLHRTTSEALEAAERADRELAAGQDPRRLSASTRFMVERFT